MESIACESVAFIISLGAFLCGAYALYRPKVALYYKMLISAVGCYALEELWAVVNTVFAVSDSLVSVRLVGTFGCLCTFLCANANGVNRVVDDGHVSNRPARRLALIAPVVLSAALIVFLVLKSADIPWFWSVIIVIVLLPAIVDAYFEAKYLLMPVDRMHFVKHIRPINALILLSYIITFSYLFIEMTAVREIIDIMSAVIMAAIVWFSRKGADQWKASL